VKDRVPQFANSVRFLLSFIERTSRQRPGNRRRWREHLQNRNEKSGYVEYRIPAGEAAMNAGRTDPRRQTQRRATAPGVAASRDVPPCATDPADVADVVNIPLVTATQMLIAMSVAPLAWLAEMAIAQTLSSQDCAGGGPYVLRALPWTPLTVTLASFVCLALAAYGAATAWRNLRLTTRMPWRPIAKVKGSRAESDWFLSRVTVISSTMFLLGLIATEIGAAIISPCSPW
jgi:hypothetical protein